MKKAKDMQARQERLDRRTSPDKAAASQGQTGGKKSLGSKGAANLSDRAIPDGDGVEIVEDVVTQVAPNEETVDDSQLLSNRGR